MEPCYKKITALFFIILFLFFPSCMHQQKAKDETLNQTKKYLATGDYQKTVDIYIAIHNKYPEDQTLLGHYVTTIEEIKINADIAYKDEDFVLAGKNYNVLLNNYSHFKGFAYLLSFDKKYLEASITECSKFLTNKGLEQYRKGNIVNAISIWKYILEFDPSNVEIKKAIDTASTQLKNL